MKTTRTDTRPFAPQTPPAEERYRCGQGLEISGRDLNELFRLARTEDGTPFLFELGVDELPPPIVDIRGQIEGEPRLVFAWIDDVGEARYFGVSPLPSAAFDAAIERDRRGAGSRKD